MNGDRRSATDDETGARSNIRSNSADDALRLEARSGKLIAIDQKNKTEITLASSAADREVEFRNPVWSPDRSKVLFIEAD